MLGFWVILMPAIGFRPDSANFIGSEPDRILRVHKEQQSRIRSGSRWQRFVRKHGQDWQARFDERTGGVVRAWGPGIELGPIPDLAAVEQAVRKFFSAHEQLLGVPISALKMGRSGYVAESDSWLVQLDEVIPNTDVPIWRAGLSVRIKQGRMVMFGIDTHPDAAILSVTPSIGKDTALAIAKT